MNSPGGIVADTTVGIVKISRYNLVVAAVIFLGWWLWDRVAREY